MCITGRFFELYRKNVYNWQLLETKQTPQKNFSLRWAEPKRNTPQFFSPAASKTRKKSQKCAQLAAIWKFWNIFTWRRICNFKTVLFFFREISPKFFRLRRAKIIGEDWGNPPIPPPSPEKLRFQVRQTNVHIWQHFGKKN